MPETVPHALHTFPNLNLTIISVHKLTIVTDPISQVKKPKLEELES